MSTERTCKALGGFTWNGGLNYSLVANDLAHTGYVDEDHAGLNRRIRFVLESGSGGASGLSVSAIEKWERMRHLLKWRGRRTPREPGHVLEISDQE